MNLLLKTIILIAAAGSAIAVAIPSQQHHDATEFNHNILDHGYINAKIPPPEDDWLDAELDKCNLSDYWTCLNRGGRKSGCEAVMDRSGECRPDVKRLIERILDDRGRLIIPGGGDKLIRRDTDPPLDEVLGLDSITVIDDPPIIGYLGPGHMAHKGPDYMGHKGPGHVAHKGPDYMGYKGPEVLVTSRTPKCLKECLTGPADGPDENRERAECVERCNKEHPDYEGPE